MGKGDIHGLVMMSPERSDRFPSQTEPDCPLSSGVCESLLGGPAIVSLDELLATHTRLRLMLLLTGDCAIIEVGRQRIKNVP
ncbi:hypothetical protein Ddc_01196 [Ditylenchus destructor]|nr:hypothetical protein Ddc_01196 [Ditylenchus destructor]